MIRKSILKAIDLKNWSIAEFAKRANIRYQSINDYLKHGKELSSKNLEKAFKTLNLEIMKKETTIEKLVKLASEMKAKKGTFKSSILKIRELEKTFGGLENENVKQQFSGFLMYSENCKGTDAITSFVNLFFDFYKENHNQLTDRLRKHDFINQLEYMFDAK